MRPPDAERVPGEGHPENIHRDNRSAVRLAAQGPDSLARPVRVGDLLAGLPEVAIARAVARPLRDGRRRSRVHR